MTGSMLDLAKGHPDPKLLPREALAAACAQAATSFSQGSSLGLAYGSRPQGALAFLGELVAFLRRQCPHESPPRKDGLLLTNGTTHGIELACTVFSRHGEVVLVEAPTYWLAVGVFKSHGLDVLAVPTDRYGIVVEEVEALLAARPEGSANVRFLYTVTSNHNPIGCSLPKSRRQALVALARRWGLLILADEVYHMLDWQRPEERPARMVCFDEAYAPSAAELAEVKRRDEDEGEEEGEEEEEEDPAYNFAVQADPDAPPAAASLEAVVISVSSFTKILAPGLRVGWIEAGPALIERIAATGYLRSGGCVATFTADAILKHLLETREADRNLAALVCEYKQRADKLVAALDAVGLPPLVKPQGGYFVWVPLGADSNDVLRVAQTKHNLTFMPGAAYDELGFPGLSHSVRLCFAWLSAEKLEEGARSLSNALAEVKRGTLEDAGLVLQTAGPLASKA